MEIRVQSYSSYQRKVPWQGKLQAIQARAHTVCKSDAYTIVWQLEFRGATFADILPHYDRAFPEARSSFLGIPNRITGTAAWSLDFSPDQSLVPKVDAYTDFIHRPTNLEHSCDTQYFGRVRSAQIGGPLLHGLVSYTYICESDCFECYNSTLTTVSSNDCMREYSMYMVRHKYSEISHSQNN